MFITGPQWVTNIADDIYRDEIIVIAKKEIIKYSTFLYRITYTKMLSLYIWNNLSCMMLH